MRSNSIYNLPDRRTLFRLNVLLLLITITFISPSFSFADQEKEEKKVIVISLSEYSAIINDLNNSVLLPIEKYRDLLERLAQLKQAAESPLPMIVEKAQYLFRPVNQAVHAEAVFTINVMRPGWHQLGEIGCTLPMGIESIEVNGSPADFLKSDDGIYLHVPSSGKITLVLKFHQPLCNDSDTGSGLCSPILLGSNTQSTIELPFTPAASNIQGGIITSTDKSQNKAKIFIVNTEPNLRFSWSRRTTESVKEETGESRMISSVSSLYLVSKNLSSVTDIIAVQVQKGYEKEFLFQINGGYKLTELIGEGIESYGMRNENGKNVLWIRMSEPVYDSTIFFVKTEKSLSAAALEIAPPSVTGAARQNGFIAVGSADPITFGNIQIPDEYSAIDVREIPGEIRKLHESEPVLGFQYRLKKDQNPETFALSFNFYPAGETLTSYVKNASATTLLNEDGICLTRIQYDLVTAGGDSFRLKIDPGFTLLSAYVNDTPANVSRQDNEIIIPIRSSYSVMYHAIEVVMLSRINPLVEDGSLDLILPSVPLPIKEYSWNLYLPDDYDYTEYGGNFISGYILYVPELPAYVEDYSKVTANAPKDEGEVSGKEETYAAKENILIDGAVAIDTKTRTFSSEMDVSASTLSLRIIIPTEGQKMSFHSILLTAEKPEITMQYEKR